MLNLYMLNNEVDTKRPDQFLRLWGNPTVPARKNASSTYTHHGDMIAEFCFTLETWRKHIKSPWWSYRIREEATSSMGLNWIGLNRRFRPWLGKCRRKSASSFCERLALTIGGLIKQTQPQNVAASDRRRLIITHHFTKLTWALLCGLNNG